MSVRPVTRFVTRGRDVRASDVWPKRFSRSISTARGDGRFDSKRRTDVVESVSPCDVIIVMIRKEFHVPGKPYV